MQSRVSIRLCVPCPFSRYKSRRGSRNEYKWLDTRRGTLQGEMSLQIDFRMHVLFSSDEKYLQPPRLLYRAILALSFA